MKILDIGMTYVKCTRFLSVGAARLERHGIESDRQYILLDRTGALMAAHHHRLFAPLTFQYDGASDRLTLFYPDGSAIEGSGSPTGPVTALDYMGMRTVDVRDVEGDWNERLSQFSGVPTRIVRAVHPGGGIDILPVTFFTTGSLAMLSARLGTTVDPRRFRANLVIDHKEPFVEDDWEGRLLRVGSAILRVRSKVPRCIVTQGDPDTGVNDLALVQGLGKFRDTVHLPDGLMPNYATPAFASYAEVVEPGLLNVGDAATFV
jgi:uncharacterized protein